MWPIALTLYPYSGANLRSEKQSTSWKYYKTTSREVDELYLKSVSALKREGSIESAISPGGIIAIAWFKSYPAIYVLKRSI